MKPIKGISDAAQRDLDRMLGGSKSLGDSNKVPYYKVPADGQQHSFRVLPGEYGESKEWFFVSTSQHWARKGNSRIPYTCLKERGEDCPFCDELDEWRKKEQAIKESLKDREVKADKAKYKRLEADLKAAGRVLSFLAPRAAYMINVADREDGNAVKVFSMAKTVFNKVMNCFSEDGGPELFLPESGHDFRIKKISKGSGFEFDLSLAIKSSALADSDAKIEDILGRRHDLNELIRFADADEMAEAAAAGIASAEVSEGDSMPVVRRKVADDDDDGDRLDTTPPKHKAKVDDDEEEEEEAEPPRKSKQQAGRVLSRISKLEAGDDDEE